MFKVLIDVPGFALVLDNGVLKADIVPDFMEDYEIVDLLRNTQTIAYI